MMVTKKTISMGETWLLLYNYWKMNFMPNKGAFKNVKPIGFK